MSSIKKIFEDNHNLKGVSIQGEIVDKESRVLSNGSYLVKLAIYDGTSTILSSSFEDAEPDLNVGDYVSIGGNVIEDKYNRNELTMKPARGGIKKIDNPIVKPKPNDGYGDQHRVSLQNYGFMTTKQGAVPASEFFKKAKELGHKAVSVTDLGVVHSFPEISQVSKKLGVKPIYGMTGLLVKDTVMVYDNYECRDLTDDIVVFDVETTGFSARFDDVIEIGATKLSKGKEPETFQRFIKTDKNVSEVIQDLTGITPKMLVDQGVAIKEAIKDFDEFIGDAMLAAHNAYFDIHMLSEAYVKAGIKQRKRHVIDTLKMSRKVNEENKRHSLGVLARKYGISLKNAHRADDDAKATAEVYLRMVEQLEEEGITTTNQLCDYKTRMDHSLEFPAEITIWVKNQTGLKNLYRLVSESHTKYLNGLGNIGGGSRPTMTWDLINENREGLIIGSGGYNGDLFNLALEKPDHVVESEINNYDVIQIEPAEVAKHLAIDENPRTNHIDNIENTWKKIVELAQKHKKFIVATDGAHYTEKEDSLVHNILVYSQLPPSMPHFRRKAKAEYPMGEAHMRTTREMIESFDYLSKEKAEEYVILNTNRLAESIEVVEPIPVDESGNAILFKPEIEGTDEEFKEITYQNAHKLYGNPLPEIIEKRLENEVNSIIDNGFAIVYMVSREIVKKSLDDGYIVGSRGSVGSSLAATMTEITEVNPMPPHYVCKGCHWSVFFEGNEELLSGFDLPEEFKGLLDRDKYTEESVDFFVNEFLKSFNMTNPKPMIMAMERHDGTCPKCKQDAMIRDGHNIPFETFLGFDGDKVPDIDLNFSGVYQSVAHRYTQEMFGEDYVFRAGTISTMAEKTAFASVRNYYQNNDIPASTAEIQRMARKVEGAKESTGQHPGGMLVVPKTMEMIDISPYQYPANNPDAAFMTSHFDYRSIEDSMLKLDILGHEAPTVMRYLEDYTTVKPQDVPSASPETMKLFYDSGKVLGVPPETYQAKTGTLGMPEMGTRVVQDVISETSPKSFGELITLSGLTHGTNVYYNNAQQLIQDGTATIKTVIGCRDDIMRYLISMGLDSSMSFVIMESVRKGKGLTPEWEAEMTKHNVPKWYIWSCKQIEYMFPRAHAAAYVLDATRIGYYKIKHPLEYTAAIFSARYSMEDLYNFQGGIDELSSRYQDLTEEMEELKAAGEFNAANGVARTRVAVNLAMEASLRDVKFGKVRMYESHHTRYLIDKETNELIPPFKSVPNLGPKVAESIYEERKKGIFKGIKDLQERTKITQTAVNHLRDMDALRDIEEVQPVLF